MGVGSRYWTRRLTVEWLSFFYNFHAASFYPSLTGRRWCLTWVAMVWWLNQSDSGLPASGRKKSGSSSSPQSQCMHESKQNWTVMLSSVQSSELARRVRHLFPFADHDLRPSLEIFWQLVDCGCVAGFLCSKSLSLTMTKLTKHGEDDPLSASLCSV